MCEQCLTWPVSFGQPLEGYTLMRARRDGNDWTKGEWGLVECNDPTYTWKKTPTPSPLWGMTDEQEEEYFRNRDDNDPAHDRSIGLGMGDFAEALVDSPYEGYRLVLAGIKAGYNKKQHGYFTSWLFDYLGEYLKTAEMVDEGDAFPDRESFAPVDLTIGRDPIPGESA